jgi:hypothetical protein
MKSHERLKRRHREEINMADTTDTLRAVDLPRPCSACGGCGMLPGKGPNDDVMNTPCAECNPWAKKETMPVVCRVRLREYVGGQYCQFQSGDEVLHTTHDNGLARLERQPWRNSLTISNVLVTDERWLVYEVIEPNDQAKAPSLSEVEPSAAG